MTAVGPTAITGLVIDSVEMSEDREDLTLTFADGRHGRFTTDGDCCSTTWIEHLTVPPDIKGATITGVRDSDYVSDAATPEQYEESRAHHEYLDVLTVYHTAIVTDRGEIIVEYRNDSNGYYGGSLDWAGLS